MDAKVIAGAQLIALKLNPEISACDAQFDQKYRVSGYTTIPFVDGEGNLGENVHSGSDTNPQTYLAHSIAMFYTHGKASALRPRVLEESVPEA
jgi:hypothetical protein